MGFARSAALLRPPAHTVSSRRIGGYPRAMRVLVIGAGLSGLAATEALLDAGARVVVIDAFPVPGGRVASFEARVAVPRPVPAATGAPGVPPRVSPQHRAARPMGAAGV